MTRSSLIAAFVIVFCLGAFFGMAMSKPKCPSIPPPSAGPAPNSEIPPPPAWMEK